MRNELVRVHSLSRRNTHYEIAKLELILTRRVPLLPRVARKLLCAIGKGSKGALIVSSGALQPNLAL